MPQILHDIEETLEKNERNFGKILKKIFFPTCLKNIVKEMEKLSGKNLKKKLNKFSSNFNIKLGVILKKFWRILF